MRSTAQFKFVISALTQQDVEINRSLMLEGKLISIVWLGVALHIGTTLEHGTQEQINGSERFPPPGAPARHRAYLIKVRNPLH